MGSRTRLSLTLTILLSLGALFPLPTADAHPFHLQAQNDLATIPEEVRWDQWLAQSISVTPGFHLTRVALFVMDMGASDVLDVAIREDMGGAPGFFNLTRGSADGPGFSSWVNIDLDPRVELLANTTYWIVAHSNEMFGEGYVWLSSDDEFAYPDGFGMISFDGFSWFPAERDRTFRVYGFNQPNVTFSVTPSETNVEPGQSVVFRIDFRNTGLGSSSALWVNVTLPPELAYLSDDAETIGGVRSGAYSFQFQDVAPGSYAFNLTTRAQGGVPDGTIATTRFTFDALDHNGGPLGSSTSDVDVTIANAVLAYAGSVAPATVAPGGSAVFRTDFTNSGQGTAGRVWANVTLPSELTYVSDDAAAIGGIRSGAFSFEFSNVMPGSYTFNVTASANGGVPNGTVATTNVAFQAADLAGASLNASAQALDVVVANAVLSLTVVSSTEIAQPGDRILRNATVTNRGAEAAEALRLTASVDVNATYLTSTPMAVYSTLTRELEWDLGALSAGAQVSVEWEVEVLTGTPDGAVVTSFVRAEAEDLAGTPIPREDRTTVTRIQAPAFAPALLLDRTWAERGDEVVASFYYNNTGSVAAPRAWINATLGNHYAVVSLSPALPLTLQANGISVELVDVGLGPNVLEVHLQVVRGLDDGLSLDLQFMWTATDGNGNVVPPDVRTAGLELRAPAVTLSLLSSLPRVTGPSVFTLNLTVANVGRGLAFGWLNLTLPIGATYQGDDGALPGIAAGDQVSWTLDSLANGTAVTLHVQLQAGGDPGPRSFRFTIDLTDGRGSAPVSLLSNAVSVEFVAVPSPFASLPWWIFLLPIGGLGALAVLALRRRDKATEVNVEEVFVIDGGGTLLAHRSNSILQYKDEDLVVAMLTAIQKYIEDVFSYGQGDTIRGLEFGERRILIEGGESHYVAIVYRGEDLTGQLRQRGSALVARIEEQFGTILADWNGDTDEIRGIAALLPLIWRKRPPTQGSE